MSILQDIRSDTEREVARRKADRSLSELRSMVADAPRVRSLYDRLADQFGLIAEIKVKSPSAGPFDQENVERAAKVYENTPAVLAVSVLTQESHFGGSLGRLHLDLCDQAKLIRESVVHRPTGNHHSVRRSNTRRKS